MKNKSELIESLKIEYRELFEKREKLNKFLQVKHDGRCFNSYSLLTAQLYAMDTYIQILRFVF